ncbi:AAA family ATPase [Kitasatospora sp. NPDC057500]|uniref:AAA family ATPase n=1 Tax=Kitasatospora sp. NPDC057500 TaxID=3346151 RepID=UPI0036C2A539
MFVERQEQFVGFKGALDECLAGHGRLLSVVGPLSSGKTTLLRAFAEQADAAGFRVLWATGSRAERELPLSLVSQFCHELPAATGHAGRAELVREVHGASATLLADSERTPLLIAVDDLHHVDPLSLHCLLHLVRRLRGARVLVVVSGTELAEPTDPQLYAELMALASDSHHELPPLSREGVGELLADAFGAPPADALVDACAKASGGNPLLTRTLIADLRLAGGPRVDPDGQVAPGSAYTAAARRYVERCDPVTRRVLAAAALLDRRPPAGLLTLARLAEVDTAAARRALTGLENAGLISDGRLPHPAARQAVLDQLPPAAATDLHLRAARILHEDGSAPLPVARHLLAAGHSPVWAGPVLAAAAEELLTTGDADLAAALLRLAHDGATDDGARSAFKVALLRAEWQSDPAAAGHRLGQLVNAARAGRLGVTAQVTTVHCLLWLGRTAEAVELLDALTALDTAPDTDAEERGRIRLLTAWTRFTHPGLLDADPVTPGVPRRTAESVVNTREALAQALESVLVKGPNSLAMHTAEQALPRSSGRGDTMTMYVAALTVLIHGDRLESAAHWTDRLLAHAGERGSSSMQGMLTAIRADIAHRAGRLADAQRDAEAALAMMSADSWSAAVGVPLGTLLLTLTARGRLVEAARHLDRPVPDAMFETVWGLHYLRARGTYYLAAGRPEAALDDFTACGDLMARWNLDLPSLVAWRVLAARAYLALGRPQPARVLAESQLTQLGSEPSRAKACALRVIAAAAPLTQRPTLLREAAEMLRACGDRLELAHTLADLSQAQSSLGDFHRARLTVRRAYDLAADCQIDALCRRLLPDVDDAVPEGSGESYTEALNSLSDAERRVAVLAAQGNTNRQIANKLLITLSTVEQHLTKVYRKLSVARRADLLVKLGPKVSNIA